MTNVLLSLVCLALPIYADVTFGQPPDPGSGNVFPFGFSYNAEYQQVYNSDGFSGPITITGLEVYNTQFNSSATQTPSGTYDIHLSTTIADSTTISPVFVANIGLGNTEVFNGNINQPWAFGDTLFIPFSTPFNYNPLLGNLLLDVVGSGIFTPDGFIGFDVKSGSTLSTRVYSPGGVSTPVGIADKGLGLTTTFVTGTIPEPSFLPIQGAALCLLAVGRFVRRKRQTQEQLG